MIAIVFSRDLGDLAFVHGLQEPPVHQTMFKKRAAPFRHRHVAHIGEHIDARHEAALETELFSDGIVVHPVFGIFCKIDGFDPVRRQAHGFLGVLLLAAMLRQAAMKASGLAISVLVRLPAAHRTHIYRTT